MKFEHTFCVTGISFPIGWNYNSTIPISFLFRWEIRYIKTLIA